MTRPEGALSYGLAPRCLTRAQAATYVGVSVDTFDAEVRPGMWPAGRARGAKGGRQTWDRLLLDAAEDRHSGLSSDSAAAPAVVDAESAAWEARLNGSATRNGTQRCAEKAA